MIDNKQNLAVLGRTLLLGFLLVGLSLLFWSIVRSGSILARDDNPRNIEAELRIQRGGLYDAKGHVLAETVGNPARVEREYAYPNSGSAVGYYSVRHGTTGVEESADIILRGDHLLSQKVQNLPSIGRDIRLTVDGEWQKLAQELMGDHKGALLLLNIADGRVLSMVSTPDYDPNLLDEQFDALVADEGAPLLNRPIQGQYQPGLVLQPFLLASALDQGIFSLGDSVDNAEGVVLIDNITLGCARPIDELATWRMTLQSLCPAPLLQLTQAWDREAISAVFDNFALQTAPDFILPTELPEPRAVIDRRLALVGQENLTITPLQTALAWSSLARGGSLPEPQLIAAMRDRGGLWESVIVARNEEGEGEEITAVSPAAARAILSDLPRHKNIIEHTPLVLSGPEAKTDAWYLGMMPAGSPRFALVVVLEDVNEREVVETIARQFLDTLLAPTP